jgi:hypothetical protein
MSGRALLGVYAICWLLSGCQWFGHSCTDMACLGPATKLQFVDEDGQPVEAKGELRDADGTHAFDCADPPRDSWFEVTCSGGTLSKRAPDSEHTTNEVRFVKDDGTLSDWQPVALSVTRHTDEDFNGDGCPCSWFEGKTKPLLVLADARNPLRQPLLNAGGASADP